MKKLLSTTEFVLAEFDKLKKGFEPNYAEIYNHANLMQQKPTLGHFVPCDEDGNVLRDPKNCLLKNCPSITCTKYRKAENRILFDGWTLLWQSDSNDDFVITEKNNNQLQFRIWRDNEVSINGTIINTIEDLVKFNLTLK